MTFCVPIKQTFAEFPGPQPGDQVLLINPDQTFEMMELIHLVFRDSKVRPTIVATVAEAVERLSEPFDLL